jgi:hypothetical protein
MLKILPLITPELFFTHNNHPYSYLPINPSIYIDKNNNAIVLIRNINYRKYRNKQFELFGDCSNSIYLIGKGNLDNVNDIEYSELKYNYNGFEQYNTWWFGMEDIRFINETTLLITIPELNKNGMPHLFLGILNNNEVLITKALPSPLYQINEKNWLPFPEKYSNKVLYSISPLRVLDIQTNQFIYSNNEISNVQDYHGSSNGIEFNYNYKDYILFLIHYYSDKTKHKWLLISTDYKDIIISKDFYFFKHSYIEFVCSLCQYNNNYIISLGVNDNSAYLIEIDESFIIDKL